MRGKVAVCILLVSCGGNSFQGTVDDSTVTDARSEASEVDAGVPDRTSSFDVFPQDIIADMQADSEASVTVEASTVDAGNDIVTNDGDGWPSDVVVEPWCPTEEVFPAVSLTCRAWGDNHGWTLTGCCLADHTCGTIQQGACRK